LFSGKHINADYVTNTNSKIVSIEFKIWTRLMTENDNDTDNPAGLESEEHSIPMTPSRAAKKRSMDELLKLVMYLIELSQGDFEALGLPEEFKDHLNEARKVKAHGARRRQIRYVVQKLASNDIETIKSKIAGMKEQRDKQIKNFHIIESLRDRVLAGGDDIIQEVMERFPGADRQQLRNLQRAAQKEKVPGTNIKTTKAMFRYLQQLFTDSDKQKD